MEYREIYRQFFEEPLVYRKLGISEDEIKKNISAFTDEDFLRLKELFHSDEKFDHILNEIIEKAQRFLAYNDFCEMSFAKVGKIIKSYDPIVENYRTLISSIEKSMDINLMPLYRELIKSGSIINGLKSKSVALKNDYNPSPRDIYIPFFEDLIRTFLKYRKKYNKKNEYVLDCSEYIEIVSNHLSKRHFSFSTYPPHNSRPLKTRDWGALPKEVKKNIFPKKS